MRRSSPSPRRPRRSPDTRFGTSDDLLERLEEITGRTLCCATYPAVEPIGPKHLLDVLVIAPATGNTIAKLAAGITDTAVTMAAKAHLRNGGPVVLAVASNDGLSGGAKNIGELLARKNYFFRAFRARTTRRGSPIPWWRTSASCPTTVGAALEGRQLQPVLLR